MDNNDDYDMGPTPANLDVADPGYVLCSFCGGEGVNMTMKCYGGSPCESSEYCPECAGTGQIEIDEPEPAPIDIMKSIRDMFR